jgi:hypothetical protein
MAYKTVGRDENSTKATPVFIKLKILSRATWILFAACLCTLCTLLCFGITLETSPIRSLVAFLFVISQSVMPFAGAYFIASSRRPRESLAESGGLVVDELPVTNANVELLLIVTIAFAIAALILGSEASPMYEQIRAIDKLNQATFGGFLSNSHGLFPGAFLTGCVAGIYVRYVQS